MENPYVQYFTGETYFQTEAPMDSSSLTRWRKRIGEEGVESVLIVTIDAAQKIGAVKSSSFDRLIVDTTVMPKAIAHPKDSRLLERSRQHLVKWADEDGIELRQNYNREALRMALTVGRYAQAKQFKRMNRELRTLKTRVGRVYLDVQRNINVIPKEHLAKANDLLLRVNRILKQQRKDKNKLYALHAPEVECISKGKARTPYEFGVKVTVATTLKEGFVVGMRSMPGNPWDGNTLAETVEQTIGHMKTNGRFDRNPLKVALGDALHAVLCGAGHNIRLLMKRLQLLWPEIMDWLSAEWAKNMGGPLLLPA